MIRLSEVHISALLRQPESGMGFQLVDLELKDGRRQRGVAYNAELVLTEAESPIELRQRTYEALVANATPSLGLVASVSVRNLRIPAPKAVREQAPTSEAKDAPIEQTKAGEAFVRFSAYHNDRRVTSDKRFLPGTYATTAEDAKNVHTGSEAVKRYALPNPKPASWKFTSRPNKDTPIQRGRVAPANNQPGGGVEVIFPEGTQPFTTTGPEKIPD